ncbi:hypothetical protein [Fontibacillus phaseoli]|nr:hypothetical protein [Fontibacillus phaseoli]
MKKKTFTSTIVAGILSFALCIPLVAADTFVASRNPVDNVKASI